MATIWESFENAIFDWVKLISLYPDDKIVWLKQNKKILRPIDDFIGLLVISNQAIFQPDSNHEFILANPNGSQVLVTHSITKRVVLLVQVFDTERFGDDSANFIANKLQNSLVLSSIIASFSLVGASCFDRGIVRDLSEVLESDFEARSFFDTSFYLADNVTENNTWVEMVQAENEIVNETFDIP